MRHPLEKLPEIVAAYSRDGLYFASIRLSRAGVGRVFELGISRASYLALRRVFQTRPFDALPGLRQRYYFEWPHRRNDADPNRCSGTIRIEQDRRGRNMEFELPQQLIANLLWFYEMETLEPARHLRCWLPQDE
ncbi:MAG TPA: hypothetical protein PLQ87_01160 [Phycisphaerae bacterium]|nr:hypothetical protein [Phycisphaerae bacterium]